MTNEEVVKEKLDKLAEYEAQRDLLGLEKKGLLDEVQVPEEVKAIVEAGMKRLGEVPGVYASERQRIKDEGAEKRKAIVIPPEVVEILARIDGERREVVLEQERQLAEIDARVIREGERIRGEIQEKTGSVIREVEQRKREIEEEFRGKEQAVDENIRKLTDEIKVEVKEIGFSVSGKLRMARYTKGKKSWITDRLEKYTEDHPDIKSCYTVGGPSIAIVRVEK